MVIVCVQNMNMSYKVGYYEQLLRINRDKFEPSLWTKIEDVMKKKNPFK
jgi:hypothetical protein